MSSKHNPVHLIKDCLLLRTNSNTTYFLSVLLLEICWQRGITVGRVDWRFTVFTNETNILLLALSFDLYVWPQRLGITVIFPRNNSPHAFKYLLLYCYSIKSIYGGVRAQSCKLFTTFSIYPSSLLHVLHVRHFFLYAKLNHIYVNVCACVTNHVSIVKLDPRQTLLLPVLIFIHIFERIKLNLSRKTLSK